MSRKACFGLPLLNLEDIICDKLVVAALLRPASAVDVFRKTGARDVLLLTRDGGPRAERREGYVKGRFKRPADVSRNNCKVAVLHGRSALALRNKEYFARFEAVLLPIDASLIVSGPSLVRYSVRGRLRVLGISKLPFGKKGKKYLVLRPRV